MDGQKEQSRRSLADEVDVQRGWHRRWRGQLEPDNTILNQLAFNIKHIFFGLILKRKNMDCDLNDIY